MSLDRVWRIQQSGHKSVVAVTIHVVFLSHQVWIRCFKLDIDNVSCLSSLDKLF